MIQIDSISLGQLQQLVGEKYIKYKTLSDISFSLKFLSEGSISYEPNTG